MVSTNKAGKAGHASFLTDSELYGNLFAFNFAGFETTSGTLAFALVYLAAHPTMQDWAAQEVRQHYCAPDYATSYPKLVRCQAVMHETLRLAAHAPMFVKAPSLPARLVLLNGSSRAVTIAPGTLVGLNMHGAHLSPQRWGADVLSFDPQRFITTSPSGVEKLQVPEGPVYAAWMLGPHACPGKKFSLVEFVVVLAGVLSKWRVEEEGSGRLVSVLARKRFNITCHLERPEEGRVRFVKRKG